MATMLSFSHWLEGPPRFKLLVKLEITRLHGGFSLLIWVNDFTNLNLATIDDFPIKTHGFVWQ